MLLFVLWLELVSSTDVAYVVTGLACAAVAALAALLAHATLEQRYAIDPRWLRWFLPAIPSTVTDTLRLTRLLFQPASVRAGGSLREVRLPREGPRQAAGRRALAVIVLGLAPGSYVVNVHEDRLLLHELPGSDQKLSAEVAR